MHSLALLSAIIFQFMFFFIIPSQELSDAVSKNVYKFIDIRSSIVKERDSNDKGKRMSVLVSMCERENGTDSERKRMSDCESSCERGSDDKIYSEIERQ